MESGARPRTVREVLARGREFLVRKGAGEARLEAELLVAHALGTDRLHLFLDLDRPVADGELDRARELLVRRSKGEPCAYLTGKREFYGREFEVGPGVLIPRPETEGLVDRGRERFAGREGVVVLDVGTGSGCLAVTLALELAGARVVATDVSSVALGYARRNAERLGAEVELREGDFLDSVADGERFDLVVCNPPYVDVGVREELAVEVREHEPAEALFAPAGDVDWWVQALVGRREILAEGGVLLVELGFDQGERVRGWLEGPGDEGIGIVWRLHRDLGGIERVLEVG